MNQVGRYQHKKRHTWFYRTEWGRFLSGLIVSAIMLVIVLIFIRPVFMTIDDARLRYIYAGYSSGTPVPVYLFCSYPLSLIISSLYSAFPAFPWYGFYQYGVIGLSSALIGKTFYRLAYRKKLPFWVAIAIHVAVYVSLALISTIIMHFEITATMIGTAGVLMLLGLDFQKDPPKRIIFDCIVSVLCIAVCYIIQFNAFYSACCYLLVVVVVHVGKSIKKKDVKRTAIRLACYVLAVAAVFGTIKMTDTAVKNTDEWKEYMVYNKYRVSFWDYPHDTYLDNPELFDSMGWSEEFYDLTQYMYFMDDRFNVDNLSQFTERFSWFNFASLDEMANTLNESLESLYSEERLVVFQTVLALASLLVLVTIAFRKKNWRKYYPQIVAMACCLGGTLFMVIFLGAKGRLPLRAFLACSIPCLTVCAYLLLSMVKKRKAENRRLVPIKAVCCLIVALLWVTGLTWTYHKVVTDDHAWRARYSVNTLEVEAFVTKYPEKVFVYDLMGAQNYNVFNEYPDASMRPTNAFAWGSSYLWTPAYFDQLEENGLSELSTENFFDKNVYYIAHNSNIYKNALEKMLEADYGPVKFIATHKVSDRFTAYRIVLETE